MFNLGFDTQHLFSIPWVVMYLYQLTEKKASFIKVESNMNLVVDSCLNSVIFFLYSWEIHFDSSFGWSDFNFGSRQVLHRWSLRSGHISVNLLRTPGSNTGSVPVEPMATSFVLLGAYVKVFMYILVSISFHLTEFCVDPIQFSFYSLIVFSVFHEAFSCQV